MSYFSQAELQTLIDLPGPCVTISFPTDPLNADPRINGVAFKNAVDEALSHLEGRQGVHETTERLRALRDELLEDLVFWKEQQQGFVAYVSGSFAKWYKLPAPVLERVAVGDHPYLVPVLSLQDPVHLYYVLELDKSHTKMWINGENQLREIEVPNLPKSIEEVTGREQNERNLQFHTQTSSPNGSTRSAMFYGSSSWQDDKDRYLEMFLHAVDKAVGEFFPKKQHLIFLSGVEELVVMFRKITKYPQLHEENLRKNDGSHASSVFLFEEAQPHIEKLREKFLDQRLTDLSEVGDQKRKVFELSALLSDAFQGKVQTLYISPEAEVWGGFDPDTLVTVRGQEGDRASQDLVSEAVFWTLRNSGDVVIVPSDRMPQAAEMVALLRY